MKMIPKFYNSTHEQNVVRLTTRRDKKGEVFHCVEYFHPRNGDCYVTFEKLSSALDFIQSNFKAKFWFMNYRLSIKFCDGDDKFFDFEFFSDLLAYLASNFRFKTDLSNLSSFEVVNLSPFYLD